MEKAKLFFEITSRTKTTLITKTSAGPGLLLLETRSLGILCSLFHAWCCSLVCYLQRLLLEGLPPLTLPLSSGFNVWVPCWNFARVLLLLFPNVPALVFCKDGGALSSSLRENVNSSTSFFTSLSINKIKPSDLGSQTQVLLANFEFSASWSSQNKFLG